MKIYLDTSVISHLDAPEAHDNQQKWRNQTVNEIIIDASILPEPLFSLADSKKMSVKKDAGIITLSPADEEIDYIDLLYGSCADGRLTVEKFQQWLREDEKDLDA